MVALLHSRNRVVWSLAGPAAVGFAVTVGLALSTESAGTLSAPGGPATALGRLTGLVGTYLLLIAVLLVGRLPPLERTIGQDRLVRWHGRLAPWPLLLIAVHGALIAVGYGQAAGTGPLHELGVLLTSYPGVLAATVGFGLLAMAGITSYRLARARMRHETWWAVLCTCTWRSRSRSPTSSPRAPSSSPSRRRGPGGSRSGSQPPGSSSSTASACRSGAASTTACASSPSTPKAPGSYRSSARDTASIASRSRAGSSCSGGSYAAACGGRRTPTRCRRSRPRHACA